MKKLTAIIMTALLLLFIISLPAAADSRINYGSVGVVFGDVLPYEENNTVIVPMRPVAEVMGLRFSWYPERETAVVSDGKTAVELVAGQRIIQLGSSVFIADSEIAIRDGELCASGAAVARLARYFGFKVDFDGMNLTIKPDASFSVVLNGERLSFGASTVERNDRHYIPAEEFSLALGLRYAWIKDEENSVATLNNTYAGRSGSINAIEGRVYIGYDIVHGDDHVLYEDNRLYIDTEAAIAVAEYFCDGVGSLNRYGNGLIILVDQPYSVRVNGTVVTFPDAQPAKNGGEIALPARPVIEAMGLRQDSDGESASIFDLETEEELNISEGLDGKQFIADERLMVSPEVLAFVAEYFGMEAEVGANLLEIVDPNAKPFLPEQKEEGPGEIRVELDGREITFPDVKPLVRDGRTLIPVRAVAEEMGMEVEWDGGDGVTIWRGDNCLNMVIGSDKMSGIRGGEEAEALLDVPAAVVDERTCVPIRAIMEFFGATVEWVGEQNLVKITSPREARKVVLRAVNGADDFGNELGFTVDAPVGAADVEYSIANGNTAIVRYRVGNTEYLLSASRLPDGVVLTDGDYIGARISRRTQVNGVETVIAAGTSINSTPAANWTVGGYRFSLEAADSAMPAEMLTLAEGAAKTFVIVKEIEPEPVEEIDFSPDMTAVEVQGSISFRELGIVMSAPEAAYDVDFRIYDGKIAEISFYFAGYGYTFRAARNGRDLSGMEEDLVAYEDNLTVGSYGELSTAVVRRTSGGSPVCTWHWGDVTFVMLVEDGDIPSLDFSQVCKECGDMSYPTMKLD